MQSDAIANGSQVARWRRWGLGLQGDSSPQKQNRRLLVARATTPKQNPRAPGGSRHHPKAESMGSWWLAPPPQHRIDGLLVARARPGRRVGTSVGDSGELSD